ncbi:hypothetical protein Taro_051673 [Colocasia esculenta]|uniref:SHSP domain-containing protein n=1 Tax=Colocasia esculenta TaxID=4460 RepID=A0A843XI01_COLES|nr:hypothetical protein [Colocasia esculenta]
MDLRTRPALAGQLVHEDFEPQYQWVSGKDADTVTVDLTGFKDEAEFKKEHLKVKIDNHGNLKVSGERPLGGGNRWLRFQKVFRMAEDCITTDIKAKLDNGVLSVVMPKLPKDQPSSKPQPPPAAAAAAPAVPPAKPEPSAASSKAQVVEPAEDGKKDTASDKKGDPAAEKPSPPAAKVGPPTYRAGSRRRLRRVMGVVVVAAMVAAAVGLGFYYWSHWNGIDPYEQLEMTDACLGED